MKKLVSTVVYALFFYLCSIYNYCIMPRIKGAIELSEFQRGRIADQYEGGFIQRKIFKNLSNHQATVDRVIVKFTREVMKYTACRSGRSGSSDRSLCLVKRHVENNHRCKNLDIAKTADVSPRHAETYLHKLGYYGRAAKRTPRLRPTNIKR